MSVSLIIPAYNAELTLLDALESVGRQTLPPDEIIVVDDGSMDLTAEIARSVAGVQVITQSNAGTAAALNAGVAAAHGTTLAFLDADDLWMPETVSIQLASLATHLDANASIGWVEEFICPSLDEADAKRFKPRPPQLGWLSGATFVKATSFNKVGQFDAQAPAWPWIDWAHRAKLAGLNFATIDRVVLKRRLHPASLSMREGNRGGVNLVGAARQALQRRRAASKLD
jgi:glycosyltransferase involved in cell wall biosynthesis